MNIVVFLDQSKKEQFSTYLEFLYEGKHTWDCWWVNLRLVTITYFNGEYFCNTSRFFVINPFNKKFYVKWTWLWVKFHSKYHLKIWSCWGNRSFPIFAIVWSHFLKFEHFLANLHLQWPFVTLLWRNELVLGISWFSIKKKNNAQNLNWL